MHVPIFIYILMIQIRVLPRNVPSIHQLSASAALVVYVYKWIVAPLCGLRSTTQRKRENPYKGISITYTASFWVTVDHRPCVVSSALEC